MTALYDIIENVALPKLRSLQTLDELMAHLIMRPQKYTTTSDEDPLGIGFTRKLHFDVAYGNLESAREVCVNHISDLKIEDYSHQDDEDRLELHNLKNLCHCVAADDRAGMAALLHAWEAQTVRNLKTEHLWEPTPFPLELMER